MRGSMEAVADWRVGLVYALLYAANGAVLPYYGLFFTNLTGSAAEGASPAAATRSGACPARPAPRNRPRKTAETAGSAST